MDSNRSDRVENLQQVDAPHLRKSAVEFFLRFFAPFRLRRGKQRKKSHAKAQRGEGPKGDPTSHHLPFSYVGQIGERSGC